VYDDPSFFHDTLVSTPCITHCNPLQTLSSLVFAVPSLFHLMDGICARVPTLQVSFDISFDIF